jgi:hypothetical protein
LSPENFFSNSCAAFGTTVEINSNSKAWLESLSRYLSLQLQEQGTGTKAGIKLYLFEVDPGNLDGKFMPPLPDQAFKEREDVLLVDRPIPAVYYTRDGQKWVNFSGYGRLWWILPGASLRLSDPGGVGWTLFILIFCLALIPWPASS